MVLLFDVLLVLCIGMTGWFAAYVVWRLIPEE